MYARRSLSVALWAGFACTPVLFAADSGPVADTAVSPFQTFAVAGDVTNESVDFVARRGALPTLYCFVPKDRWSRPSARLLRKLDESIQAVAAEGKIVVIWVTDDPAASKEYLVRIQQSLPLSHATLSVYEASPGGPAEWGINPEVDVTIVATRDGRIRKSFALSAPDEAAAEEVLAALK